MLAPWDAPLHRQYMIKSDKSGQAFVDLPIVIYLRWRKQYIFFLWVQVQPKSKTNLAGSQYLPYCHKYCLLNMVLNLRNYSCQPWVEWIVGSNDRDVCFCTRWNFLACSSICSTMACDLPPFDMSLLSRKIITLTRFLYFKNMLTQLNIKKR